MFTREWAPLEYQRESEVLIEMHQILQSWNTNSHMLVHSFSNISSSVMEYSFCLFNYLCFLRGLVDELLLCYFLVVCT